MLNRDLAELLVYLDDAGIVAKAAPLVNNAPTQEEQMDYARILRFAKTRLVAGDLGELLQVVSARLSGLLQGRSIV